MQEAQDTPSRRGTLVSTSARTRISLILEGRECEARSIMLHQHRIISPV